MIRLNILCFVLFAIAGSFTNTLKVRLPDVSQYLSLRWVRYSSRIEAPNVATHASAETAQRSVRRD